MCLKFLDKWCTNIAPTITLAHIQTKSTVTKTGCQSKIENNYGHHHEKIFI